MNPAPPAAANGAETQSLLTLTDYIALLARHRRWFFAGLIVCMAGAFIYAKLFAVTFYKAEAQFYINNRLPLEQGVGLFDAKIELSRNEQYQTSVNTELADRLLHSAEILTSATQSLAGDGSKFDLYAALRIKERDPEKRQAMLFRELRNSLITVKPVETTGLVVYTVELPNPKAAAAYANITLDLIQRKFIDLNFGYFAKARKIYEDELQRATQTQQRLAGQLRDFNRQHFYDSIDSVAQQRKAMEEQLKVNTTAIAELAQRAENLRLATSEEAMRAAQPVKIINQAEVPLKKSRPQTILLTLTAGLLYSFVFLTSLMLMGLWRMAQGEARP